MIEAQLLRLRRRDVVSAAEEAALRGAVREVREIAADACLVREGQPLKDSILLLDGWLARSKGLANGVRQITALHICGDFADLHGFTLGYLDHDLVTVAPSRIALVPHDRLQAITEKFPHLGRLLWFTTNVDAATHREWSLSLGRRSANGRIAHLFCELFVRLALVERTRGDSFDFPLTQDEISCCVGLTSVHVNRTLQELRRQGLIQLERRELTILDHGRLRQVAEFDPAYLYLEKRKI